MNISYLNPVEDFLDTLKKPTIGKVLRSIDLLEMYGQKLGMPHVKALSSGLFELRVRGAQEIRIFFSYQNSCIVLLHGYVKKSQKTPINEIEIARKRQKSLTRS